MRSSVGVVDVDVVFEEVELIKTGRQQFIHVSSDKQRPGLVRYTRKQKCKILDYMYNTKPITKTTPMFRPRWEDNPEVQTTLGPHIQYGCLSF